MWTKTTAVTVVFAACAALVFQTSSAISAEKVSALVRISVHYGLTPELDSHGSGIRPVDSASVVTGGIKECIPVQEVTAMIFQKNGKVATRSGQRVPQLECLDGCDNSDILSVICIKDKSNVDGVTVQWMCKSTDDSQGKVFEELNIICETCGSQPGSRLAAGSCRLQYRLKRSDDMICRALSIVMKFGRKRVENIARTITKMKKEAQECAKGDVSNCIRGALHLVGFSVTKSTEQSFWNCAKMAGSEMVKLVSWKVAATAGATITVAGITYYIMFCNDDAAASDRVPELVGQANFKLL